ncbi:MAG: T9SS type A sorting domain-containing protein [Saprospiraceae bacterium]|nr:T9SS type A sorting domain-containing protein [Saprospiraceae bacterium]
MAIDRIGATADTLNGKIYVTGGGAYTGITSAHRTMEIFNPVSGWSTSPVLMNTGRAYHACKNVGGKLYVAGGLQTLTTNTALNSTECFDPQLGIWANINAMNVARRESGAAVLEGNFYMLGGRVGPVGNAASIAKVEWYNLSTSINERNVQHPSVLLSRNIPNPFASHTVIPYELKRSGQVLLQVFDLNGRAIATLFNGPQGVGEYSVTWDATGMPPGVYIYRLQTEGGVAARKCILQNH